MPRHHPMDTLHGHLAKVAEHGARVHADAETAAAAHEASREAERRDSVNGSLTTDGG